MNVAKRTPFAGKPIITMPEIFGMTPGKPFMTGLFAIGRRPITFTLENLPDGLTFNGKTISGALPEGEYTVKVTAENASGKAEKTIKLISGKRMLRRTPLMGFTSWNAFGTSVTADDMVRTAEKMTELGLCDYGYRYMNLDSSWQDAYGGEFDAIQPDSVRFPDMEGMVEKIHSMGLYVGIYSTPFVSAWGCPKDKESIPGTTQLPADESFKGYYPFPIGKIRKERNNVRQWEKWGIDYLKYDWRDTDRRNAQLMRDALDESEKDFVYCVTVLAHLEDADFYMENVNSWRSGEDTDGNWKTEKELFLSYPVWEKYTGNGHWYDLDMLSIGQGGLYWCNLTDDEKIFQYSARAFLGSPIQLGCPIECATEEELDLFCNEEVIAVNQDALLAPAKTVKKDAELYVFEKELFGGDLAVGIFNASDETRTEHYRPDKSAPVRDLWLKEDTEASGLIEAILPPHSAKLYRIKRV